MKMIWLLGCSSTLAFLATPALAQTQPAEGSEVQDAAQAPVAAEGATAPTDPTGASSGPVEIVVTANKRLQAINSVGLTISAASGADLTNRGIDGPEDLAKLVPGFTFTQSLYSTPVYTLRGIGLGRRRNSIATSPTALPMRLTRRRTDLPTTRNWKSF